MKTAPAKMAVLATAFLLLFAADLSWGSVRIPIEAVWDALTGAETKPTWKYIVTNYRLPKSVTAVLAGVALAVSGLLMQTLFRNALAGPYVLGLSSGSSLGVALVLMGSSLLPASLATVAVSGYGMIIASVAGSFLVMLAVLLTARRVQDNSALLVVGLMFGSFTSALVGVLAYFSSAEQLQRFTFWSMGSLGNLPWKHVGILAAIVLAGLVMALICVKRLDALLLGPQYAQTLGVNFKKSRTLIVIATCLLVGAVTAFAGPIAFVGMATPHMARLVFKTHSHGVLLTGTIMLGGILLLICDMLTQGPWGNFVLPINAVTSIIGAPVIISLLVKRRSLWQ